ncbi:MAG TPA: hypothetical protein VIM61_03150 [Chthoniobacterales bacterium]
MRSLFFITLALLSGCEKPDLPEPPRTIDHELRTFMGIRTLDASFTLPDSASAYYPVTLLFADGQQVAEIKGPAMMSVGTHQPQPFRGHIQLLWQFESNQFRRAAIVDGSNSRDLSDAFPHWQQFSSAGWRPVPMDEHLSYQGVSILGLLASSSAPQLYPTSATLATAAKYVVAIGIVYDSDSAALRTRFLSAPK